MRVGGPDDIREQDRAFGTPRTAWPASWKIFPIEGEKAAARTTGRRMPGSVLSLHRYHSEAEEKETFL
jgi:hypothetical protein